MKEIKHQIGLQIENKVYVQVERQVMCQVESQIFRQVEKQIRIQIIQIWGPVWHRASFLIITQLKNELEK